MNKILIRKRLFRSYASPYSSSNSRMRSPKNTAPFSQYLCFTTNSNSLVIPFISGLHRICRPSTIQRFVIPIIVYSIYGIIRRWTRTHIIKKISEALPSFAQRYSTTRIIFVSASASCFNSEPNFIFISLSFCGAPMLHERVMHPF